MRILLVGQAAFAEEVLRGLEAAGDTIAAVLCPPDAGPKPDPVKAAAKALKGEGSLLYLGIIPPEEGLSRWTSRRR